MDTEKPQKSARPVKTEPSSAHSPQTDPKPPAIAAESPPVKHPSHPPEKSREKISRQPNRPRKYGFTERLRANRRLRCALMRIADNLVRHCNYYRAQADLDTARGIDARAIRVKVAKKSSQLAYACVAGDEPLRHPCFQQLDSIMEKLRALHQMRQTPVI
jgi:hypothetical protein